MRAVRRAAGYFDCPDHSEIPKSQNSGQKCLFKSNAVPGTLSRHVFYRADLMSNLANAKRQERARSFGMQSLQSPRQLIIDELGYQPLSADQAHELF